MKLTHDGRNPGRIIGDVRRDEFNTIMSLLNDVLSFYKENPEDDDGDVTESNIVIVNCEAMINQLTKYSYFDVENDIVKVSFFARELSMLLNFMVAISDSSGNVDHFDDLVDSGSVNIWENK